MEPTDNPYQPPTGPRRQYTHSAVNWRSFWWLNLGLVGVLTILPLTSLLLVWFGRAQTHQEMGDRYASYDHEVEIYFETGNAVIFIVAVFGLANLLWFVFQFKPSWLLSGVLADASANRDESKVIDE